jgi:hypothetical protein
MPSCHLLVEDLGRYFHDGISYHGLKDFSYLAAMKAMILSMLSSFIVLIPIVLEKIGIQKRNRLL